VLAPGNADADVGLKEIGCSNNEWDRVSVDSVPAPPPTFTWISAFGSALLINSPSLVITFVLTLAIYGIARAIGWVIGGFKAS
jgi:hypothetical protein